MVDGAIKSRASSPISSDRASFLNYRLCVSPQLTDRRGMDAYRYFATIAKPNYEDAKRNADELRFLWNAIVSLNTVPEFLALDQLDYDLDLDRQTLDIEANKIREKFPALRTLKKCANTFKHVRSIPRKRNDTGFSSISSSTAISPADQSTWIITVDEAEYKLVDILDEAFEAAKKCFDQ